MKWEKPFVSSSPLHYEIKSQVFIVKLKALSDQKYQL